MTSENMEPAEADLESVLERSRAIRRHRADVASGKVQASTRFWTAPDIRGAKLYDRDRLVLTGELHLIEAMAEEWNESPPNDLDATLAAWGIDGSAA